MVQTTAIHRPFHLQLLPLHAISQQVINVEIVEYTHGQKMLYQQNLMSLGADTNLPNMCDDKDVTIAILEGNGSLTLNEEIISLEPGRFIFIPAQRPHTVQAHTRLVFLLCRSESDADVDADVLETAWTITL
jgi:mannose-6-phosphate isomerase-like protein (cupin superfamily)